MILCQELPTEKQTIAAWFFW